MTVEDNLIFNWSCPEGYRLAAWDSGRRDWRGQTEMRYKLFYHGKVVFHDAGFCGSPMHADDSPQTIAALLGFLALKPGDTDPEYFQDYSAAQLEWAMENGEELGMIVLEMEERAKEERERMKEAPVAHQGRALDC